MLGLRINCTQFKAKKKKYFERRNRINRIFRCIATGKKSCNYAGTRKKKM